MAVHLRSFNTITWLLLAGCLACLSACAGPVAPTPTPEAIPSPEAVLTPELTPAGLAQWNLMIYMHGDADLTEAALANFNEMEAAGGSTAAVKVAVQLTLPNHGARRYLVQNDTDFGQIASPVIDDLGTVDMTDPTTLRDFILWAGSRFPAQRYALVIWGHGLGWAGAGLDARAGDVLSLQALSDALNQARLAGGPQFFEVIGFDASLMAQLEVLDVISPYGRLAVASQEASPASGWDYFSTLAALRASPGMDGSALAKQICEDYISYYVVNNPHTHVTLSTVKLSEVGAVVDALGSLVETLQSALPRHMVALGNARASVESFGLQSSGVPSEPSTSVDVWHLAGLLRNLSDDLTVQQAAYDLANAVAGAVLFNVRDAARSSSHGIALYFPLNLKQYDATYAQKVPLATSAGWGDVLQRFGELLDASPPLTLESANITPSTMSIYEPAFAEIELIGPGIEAATLVIGELLNGAQYLARNVQVLWPERIQLDHGITGLRWSEKPVSVSGTLVWDGRVAVLSDGSLETPAPAWPFDRAETRYAIYGRYLRQQSPPAEARLIFDHRSGRLEQIWAWRASGSAVAPFEILPRQGDQFEVYRVVMDSRGKWTMDRGVILTFGDHPLTLTWQPAQDRSYIAIARVMDRAGRIAVKDVRLQVANRGLNPDFRGYARFGEPFSFLYPASWHPARPQPDGSLVALDSTGRLALMITRSEKDDASAKDALAAYVAGLRHVGDVLAAPVFTTPQRAGLEIGRAHLEYLKAGSERPFVSGLALILHDGHSYLVEVRGPDVEREYIENVLDIVIGTWRFQE